MSNDAGTVKRRGFMRSLYDWMMANASGRHAWAALVGVSFAESSFFPIAARRDADSDGAGGPQARLPDGGVVHAGLRARRHARLCIGALLYDSVGQWLIALYGYGERVEEFRAFYAEYGAWVILIKGVSPIPYKLVTIVVGLRRLQLSDLRAAFGDHARRALHRCGRRCSISTASRSATSSKSGSKLMLFVAFGDDRRSASCWRRSCSNARLARSPVARPDRGHAGGGFLDRLQRLARSCVARAACGWRRARR